MIGLSYELGYGVYKDNDLALKYYLKAYETEGGEPESVIELYIHLGKVLYHMKGYDEALKYLDYAHKEIRYNTPDLDRVNNLIMVCVNEKKITLKIVESSMILTNILIACRALKVLKAIFYKN